MVKAVMKRQEIEKKEETEEVFKGLGSLRKRPGNAWREAGGIKEIKTNKGISELRQREKVSGESVGS